MRMREWIALPLYRAALWLDPKLHPAYVRACADIVFGDLANLPLHFYREKPTPPPGREYTDWAGPPKEK